MLPLDIDRLNRAVAVDFSIFPEIPSHPMDLEVSRRLTDLRWYPLYKVDVEGSPESAAPRNHTLS